MRYDCGKSIRRVRGIDAGQFGTSGAVVGWATIHRNSEVKTWLALGIKGGAQCITISRTT